MTRKMLVAVHGIGDQFRYETIQAVANQMCRYCGQPSALPLGKFHSALFVEDAGIRAEIERLEERLRALHEHRDPNIQPPLQPPAALLLTPPGPVLPADVGFAEVYWAHIPRMPVKDERTLEEAKKWARTIVERVRLQYHPTMDGLQLAHKNYEMAATVLEQMIESVAVLERLLYLAEKAGMLKFDLSKVMIDFLGDVQIVAEFGHFRDKILAEFDNAMERVRQKDPTAEIHIIAHSEGTVIAFLGLLRALSQPRRPAWVERVRSFMTIGSPINKHIVLWPELFKECLQPQGGPLPAGPIVWHNYYDHGDPVGFDLQTTREWLGIHGWSGYFDFTDDKDHGFTRYPFPGKAHTDYWADDEVFGHFIQNVVKPTDSATGKPVPGPKVYTPPASNIWTYFSPAVPFAIYFALCYLAVYLVYKGVAEYIQTSTPALALVANVLGISLLLATVTVAARLPRLTMLRRWWYYGWAMFAGAAVAYWLLVSGETRVKLGSWVQWLGFEPDPDRSALGVIAVGAALMFIVPAISRRCTLWGGARLLVILGGLAITLLVLQLILAEPNPKQQRGPLWPLLLAGAVFLYLWWLAALLFDLAFIWARYIRWSVTEMRLRQLQAKTPLAIQVRMAGVDGEKG